MKITYLGHSAFQLETEQINLLIDPFISDNPKAAVKAEQLNPDVILLTHGHGDHLGDTVAIAKRSQAPVLAIVELAAEIAEEGVETYDPNLGGTVNFEWGSVKLVPAWHTSTTPKGTVNTPAGLLIKVAGKTIYHLGDTALFSDLALVAKSRQIDVALMCIGGHYTMDRHDAVLAADLIAAKTIIPCHYDTFPVIQTDAQAFKYEVEAQTDSKVEILVPGENLELAQSPVGIPT